MSDVLLIRKGNHLEACDEQSGEVIQAIAHGEQVIASVRRARNPKHHRKMFLLLAEIVKNTDEYLDVEDLLEDIKLRMGYARRLQRPNGTWVVRTRSISFANMGQAKFEKFYNRAVEIITTEILPGIAKPDLEARIEELLNPQPQEQSA